MTRLQQGEFTRIIAICLSSALIASSCPAFAQTSAASGGQSVTSNSYSSGSSLNNLSPQHSSLAGDWNIPYAIFPSDPNDPNPSNPSKAAQATPAQNIPADSNSAPATVNTSSQSATATTASPETNPARKIAESPDISKAPMYDPYSNYLPSVTGQVSLRRPFKLTVTGGLVHNLSFRDASVRAVLAELARQGGVNILVDKSVEGTITGELHDLTITEALDSVLASTGYQSRVLDNNTVIVGSRSAMVALGLNRSAAKAFQLSYADTYEVCQILMASVFNTGLKVQASMSREISPMGGSNTVNTNPVVTTTPDAGTGQALPAAGGVIPDIGTLQPNSFGGGLEKGQESTQIIEDTRNVTAIRRRPLNEVGALDAGTLPEKIKLQGFQNEQKDYAVSANNGGVLVMPDIKNRQVIVVGTQDDLIIAEEAIHLLDKRPREVHIQVSLVELDNQGIRQFGATLNTQGNGMSANVSGNNFAPLVQPLNTLTPTVAALPGLAANTIGNTIPAPPTIGGLTATNTAQTMLNFLALSKGAGGVANIGTFPLALNVTLNMLLQTNKAKIIANPSVVAEDNTEAFIEIAEEIVKKVVPVITTSAGGQIVIPTPEITKVGIFLDLLAKITQDGFITLRLRPRVSIPIGVQTFGVAPNQTQVTLEQDREVILQEVRVKDGQTLVVAGLFQEEENAQLAKIPYAAETPLLGALFRNTVKSRQRTELMLLLTPRIIEDAPPSFVKQSTWATNVIC